MSGFADSVAVRLHAYGLDDRIRPAPAGQLTDRLRHFAGLPRVNDLDVVLACERESLWHQIDADHPSAAVPRDPRAHLADRAEPEHRHRAALGNRRVLDGLPRRGQHV